MLDGCTTGMTWASLFFLDHSYCEKMWVKSCIHLARWGDNRLHESTGSPQPMNLLKNFQNVIYLDKVVFPVNETIRLNLRIMSIALNYEIFDVLKIHLIYYQWNNNLYQGCKSNFESKHGSR